VRPYRARAKIVNSDADLSHIVLMYLDDVVCAEVPLLFKLKTKNFVRVLDLAIYLTCPLW